jgi:uncharacterized membrane protein YccF (DUF307 family)
VKRINYALLAFVTFAAILTLTGCGDDKQISEVKALPFANTNMTVDNANPSSTSWASGASS